MQKQKYVWNISRSQNMLAIYCLNMQARKVFLNKAKGPCELTCYGLLLKI